LKTKNILLILLAVAIFIGALTMIFQRFDTIAEANINEAIREDIISLGIQAQNWWQTPAIQEGGGQTTRDLDCFDLENIISFLCKNAVDGVISTDSGYYSFAVSGLTLTIEGVARSRIDIVKRGIVELDKDYESILVE
jgi:hypothetical protein